MKSRDFAFWLQGFFELGGGVEGLSSQQVAMVKQHLGLVFQHDPDIAAKPHAALGPTVARTAQQFPYPGTSGDVPPNTGAIMIC